ncbi:hypothetical protein NIES2134_118100 [Thermostichus vulcanus NIES-2134]|nr:hypothetical protein NIES2134_118100 [Thermostichus vulcanus NIES-2134]
MALFWETSSLDLLISFRTDLNIYCDALLSRFTKRISLFFAGNKLSEINTSIPFASTGIILLTLLASALLSLHLFKVSKSHLLRSCILYCAIVQAFPMVCGILLMSILKSQLDFSLLLHRYGLMFLFFALWGLWPLLLVNSSSKSTLSL